MDDSFQRADDNQPVPVKNASNRRRCLLLLLLLSLLLIASTGVITGILLQKSTMYESETATLDKSAPNMTTYIELSSLSMTKAAEIETRTFQESAQNITIELSSLPMTKAAEIETRTFQESAQNMTIELSSLSMTKAAEIETRTFQESAQNMTIEVSSLHMTKAAEFESTTFQESAQNMTIEPSTFHMTKAAEFETTTFQKSAQNMTIGTKGKGFLILFLKKEVNTTKNIYVTSKNGVQMKITTSPRLDPSLKAKIDREIYVSSSQHIVLPPELNLQSSRIEEKSVIIETSGDVFVFSHEDGMASIGSTTVIPLHKLSTKYVVIQVQPHWEYIHQHCYLAFSAIEDNTTILITFMLTHGIPLHLEGRILQNGDNFTISLDRFQTYHVEHILDLTGTILEASAPIAVFSGIDCDPYAYSNNYCHHLFEQLPPADSVDTAYIVPPNMDNRGTVIRVKAIENTKITYMIGRSVQNRSIYKLDYFDTRITSSQTCFIESETPFLVAAIGLPIRTPRQSLAGPTMTIVPGINQYLDYYKMFVPFGYDHNYISIMIRESSKDSFRVNGTVVETGDIAFEENFSVRNVSYNVRSIRVAEGELTASTLNGERFGLISSGITDYKAYAFSGNSVLP